MENELIEKFIIETGLKLLKKQYITNYNVIIIDNTNDSLLITQPLFTENLVVVSFDNIERTYLYKKGIDNKFHWFMKCERALKREV